MISRRPKPTPPFSRMRPKRRKPMPSGCQMRLKRPNPIPPCRRIGPQQSNMTPSSRQMGPTRSNPAPPCRQIRPKHRIRCVVLFCYSIANFHDIRFRQWFRSNLTSICKRATSSMEDLTISSYSLLLISLRLSRGMAHKLFSKRRQRYGTSRSI